MKTLRLISMVLTTMLMTFTLASCGDDDDELSPADELAAFEAAEKEEIAIDGVKYSIANGIAEIAVQSTGLSGDIEIPKTFTYNGSKYTVKYVAESAFDDTEITSITLPNSLTSLSYSCFFSCSNLKSVDIPSSISTIEEDCFAYCKNLDSINLPNSIRTLGEYCFRESGLKSVKLSNSLTTLPRSCFYNCTSLTSIDIPSNITLLETKVFYYCYNLTTVICRWDDISKVTTESSLFSSKTYSKATLYVPKGTKSSYEETSPWSNFSSIVEMDD